MVTQDVSAAAPRTSGKRWIIVFLLLLGGMVNFIDRTALSVAAPEMMRELNLTNADIGLLGTVFSLIYAIFQLPSGWLIDKLGAKKVYSFALILWSGATMLTGACSSLMGLIFARGTLGVTEAPCWPSAAKITAAWFPKKERALATGIWDAASKWGPAIAPPLLVALMVAFGWRALFYIAGGFGILFGLFLIAFYREPEKTKWLPADELAYIRQGGGGTAEELGSTPDGIRWRDLFGYRSVWGMILGWFCYIWMFNILTYFVPLYLLKTQNVNIQTAGLLASVPFFGGIVGAFVGGYVSKWLVDRNIAEPLVAKRATISVCALLGGFALMAAPFFTTLVPTLVLLTVGMAMLSALSANGWALPGDVAPRSMVGSVGGIQNFGGYFAGSLSPLVTGMIADATGSYAMAFISGGVIAACAALCYWFIVNKPIEAKA
ncbi:MFS transporter [Azospirillum picis]|uniref:Sugar phosphate permease n=1 Tax=Azospirillum picis TaxID=488438 RepID=A0ABU0MJM2_9PROT|nr:MFS transporter [Azospirillum picis]MBP2299857.1 sugar phosphate permease [Azospirillum picis]MDQ0533653.1 sugar phosphate permease [Azospirillum picis]